MPTLFERPLSKDETLMHGFVKRAVDEFGSNMAAPRIMRGLSRDQPWLFYSAAMHLMKSEADSLGRRYATVLLLSNPEVIARLTDPGELTRNDTTFVFKCFMDTDRLIDVKLARHLPGRYGEIRALDLDASARMLDILDQISPGRRLIPIMGYLTQHPDTNIAAKAALLIARRIRNAEWVRRHVNVKDARIRANVVEGLWGADAPYAKSTYEDCLEDENNRVVGNAMVGLYLLGEDSVGRRIARMADDYRVPFRWTSAWVMGQIGNPENVPLLQRLITDDSPGVRGAALKGLFAIRRVAAARTPVAPEPAVEIGTEDQAEIETEGSGSVHTELRQQGLMLDGTSFRFRD